MPKKTTDSITVTSEDGDKHITKMSEQPKKRSIDHQHTYYPDPTDETDNYIAMICQCGFGYLQRKN